MKRIHVSKRQIQQSGFSLIELIVVIAVIGVLLALLLPAVQETRSAARRTQCHNNLRLQALAIQNHVSTFGHFPTGGWGYAWLGVSDLGNSREQPGGWVYNILPFCEQDAIHKLAPSSAKNPLDPLRVREFANQPLVLLNCPERRAAQPRAAHKDVQYLGSVTLTTCAKSDYAINGGTVFFRSISGPNSLSSAIVDSYAWPDTTSLNGVSFLRSLVRYADITDGSSQVIAVGEKWISGNEAATNGDDQPLYSGDCLDIRRWAIVAPAHDGNSLGSETTFGSAHEDSAGFALCDGSVRSIAYFVDPKVFGQLCARNDGGVIGSEY